MKIKKLDTKTTHNAQQKIHKASEKAFLNAFRMNP